MSRIALITGASRGIGAATAVALARDGFSVALNYRPSQRGKADANSVVDRIRLEGGSAAAFAGDVSDPRSVDQLAEAVQDEFGEIDILVLNAALSRRTPWEEIDIEEWNKVMSVNLSGALSCAKRIVPGMSRRGWGRVVTLGSVTSEQGEVGALHYVTSKAGILGFTRSLAREVGASGVTVNCVMPGAILTEKELEEYPDQLTLASWLAEVQCLPRRGRPEDIADAISFLASERAAFITGQVLNVDGGWIHY